ncbi:hypothetical protein M378DRAFT_172960 [Amanita muscaria Koide BX008]|uniref:Uncharacterized protein n=1 Tax=Amanita muscaria (strain Koide BX008) TaxID=946122 RepID=A0A0C2W4P5_AMAMK|nr:hypothetical protein M378DRAFT_172960 [Amanita muscaria Koide BX008]
MFWANRCRNFGLPRAKTKGVAVRIHNAIAKAAIQTALNHAAVACTERKKTTYLI